MKPKYEIWLYEDGEWQDYGEGPVTQKQAERIVKECRASFPGFKYRAVREGQEPKFVPTVNGIQPG